jgi:hypothetical protein
LQIVVWEILARSLPYENLTSPAAIMKFVSVEKGRPDLNCIPDDCPPEVFDLIQKLIAS